MYYKDKYILEKDYKFKTPFGIAWAPKGFECDGCSIPKFIKTPLYTKLGEKLSWQFELRGFCHDHGYARIKKLKMGTGLKGIIFRMMCRWIEDNKFAYQINTLFDKAVEMKKFSRTKAFIWKVRFYSAIRLIGWVFAYFKKEKK